MTPSGDRTEGLHFDEMTGLLFLDQQLDEGRAREITQHTNSCAACRELLRVLKNENVWLRQAMIAEEEPVPARFAEAPRRGGSWAWAAALGFGTAGAYTLWNGLIDPWMSQASEVGFTQGNLMSMLFFSGAFWNGWNSVLTAVEFLALGTLGAVAAWLLRRYFRRSAKFAAVMGGIICAAMLPSSASAAQIEHGSPNYTLAAGQEIKSDLIVRGADHAQIDGTLDGDLIAFSHIVEVNGHVKGDVIVFAQELHLNGPVDGNVRVFAQLAFLRSTVERNVMAFVNTLDLDEASSVGGSVTTGSQTTRLGGKITGDLLAGTASAELNGPIGGNVKILGRSLQVTPSAQIAGRAEFEGPEQPEIAAGAKLASPFQVTIKKPTPGYLTWRYYWHQTLRWGAAFVLGIVFFLVAPAVFLDASNSAKKAGLAMGIGLLFLVGLPVAAIIACVTIVGLGLGIVTFLTYVVAVYMSQIFIGEWLGEKLLGAGVGAGAIIGRLALGLAILRVIRLIPFIGPLSALVVIVWGLGAYVLTIHKRLRQPAVA